MPNYREFFKQLKIFDENEFDRINQICSFEFKMPSRDNQNTIITIKNNEIIPIELFKKIDDSKEALKKLSIIIEPTNRVFNAEQFYNYLTYFKQKFVANNAMLIELLDEKNVSIDSNNVSIKFFSNAEKDALESIISSLKSFLVKNGFHLDQILLIVDEIKQRETLTLQEQQQKAIDEKIALMSSKIQTTSSKFEKLNKITGKFIDIENITNEMVDTYVNVSGEIFSIDKKTLKNGNLRYTFEIYDYKNGAISLVGFPYNAETNSFVPKVICIVEHYLETFKIGDWVESSIQIQSNKYTNFEVSGKIMKICHSTKPKDLIAIDSENDKRCELLMRTKMSAFDGICSVKEILEHAQSLGHKSVGFVDRFNVQSFPEIISLSKKYDIKPIFGSEFEIIPKHIDIVVNEVDKDLNDATYVIFDIETTGLYNEVEELIEFGAIKYRNGIIVDHIDFFVKPNKPLSNKIMKLTHINNDMLVDAIDLKSALNKIIDWIGNDVLIAHNGINFDLAFINKMLEKNNMPLIKNCLIDTMQLSRAINIELAQHSLGRLCRHYKIDYVEEVAHRADKDAEFLLIVWENLNKSLKQKNITNIKQVNSLQTACLRASQHGHYVEIYAKNQQGIKDLYRLISLSLTKQLYQKDDESENKFSTPGRPKIHHENLLKYRENLIICPNPYDGEVWEAALNGLNKELKEKIEFYDYIFIAPIKNIENQFFYEEITKNDAIKITKRIIDASIENDKKIIAVSDAFYLMKWQKQIHSVYVHTKQLGGKRHRLYMYGESQQIVPDLHYLTTQEMFDEFKFIQNKELLKQIIVENCNDFVKKIEDVKPLKTQLCTPNIGETKLKLEQLVWENAKKIFGEKIPKDIEKRVEKELKMITGQNYDVIYWISHLLVKQSLADGYLVGSRGSVGSSLVAYLSEISEVNPLASHYICKKCQYYEPNQDEKITDGFDLPEKICPVCGEKLYGDGHNIPFETFLGFKGEKVPDIDLNFSGEYQAKAHNFVKNMFGHDHTFRAGTISTVAQKTAYGYVKNYFEEIKSDKQISNSLINWYSSKCIDVKRTVGQHPGGIIVVPKEYEIFDFSPYNYPADDKTQTWYTTHFAFESLHDTLLKFDILGHDDPTTLKYLHEITKVDPKTIPFSDKNVLEQFSSSKTLSITDENYDINRVGATALPEFGTNFVKGMLSQTNPQSFADLIRISGLSHGTDVWLNNAQDLINKANMKLDQVIACRDDIMTYLISKGLDTKPAFEIMEAVRKGKGIKPEWEDLLKQNNIDQWYIDSCKKIKYLFPKAHATAYVTMAWRVAWYKMYYPLEFYATYFSVRSDVFDVETIIQGQQAVLSKYNSIRQRMVGPEANLVKQKEKDLIDVYEVCLEMFARGFNISNIDLKKSQATKFIVDKGTIYPSFNALDGLGIEAAKSIIKARKEKPFTSILDFSNRTSANGTILEKMKTLGVFQGLDEDDQMSLFS